MVKINRVVSDALCFDAVANVASLQISLKIHFESAERHKFKRFFALAVCEAYPVLGM